MVNWGLNRGQTEVKQWSYPHFNHSLSPSQDWPPFNLWLSKLFLPFIHSIPTVLSLTFDCPLFGQAYPLDVLAFMEKVCKICWQPRNVLSLKSYSLFDHRLFKVKGRSMRLSTLGSGSSSDIQSFPGIPSFGQVPNGCFVSKAFLIRLHSCYIFSFDLVPEWTV